MKYFLYKLRGLYLNIQSFVRLIKNKNISKNNGIINVVYFVQYIPAWNKIESLYIAMKEDSRFNVYLVCIPSELGKQCLHDDNDVYYYFVSKGYNVINALNYDDTWYDVRQLNPDFVFHLRPYDQYLPDPYKSGQLSKYTCVCCVLYAASLTKNGGRVTLNKEFFKNVSIYFADCEELRIYNQNRFPLSHKVGIRKSIFLGNLSLLNFINRNKIHTSPWDKLSNKVFKIVWTPRWTSDIELGGTNFFKYANKLLEYAYANLKFGFVFRPHPMALDNFVKNGEMTMEERKKFENSIVASENVILDKNPEYFGTFFDSDILISDFSSVMYDYLMTEKPIIFCNSSLDLELSDSGKMLLNACYIVSSWEELIQCMESILHGDDPLKEIRRLVKNRLLGSDIDNLSNKVLEVLSDWVQ